MGQKLGQHFLVNPKVPGAITAALRLAADDTVIEIGPGHGELTQAIIDKVEEGEVQNVKLVMVEKDPLLAAEARNRFRDRSFATVVEGDILEFLPGEAARDLMTRPYKLAGNLPYYLTGHLLRIVGELERKPLLAAFMVQQEVAERIAAAPPHMNRLAAAVQFWALPEVMLRVPRADFDPPPAVESAVILLRPRQETASVKPDVFYAAVRAAFAQPRKTLFNNLRDAFAARALGAGEALRVLNDCKLDRSVRPQDLPLGKIEELARRFGDI